MDKPFESVLHKMGNCYVKFIRYDIWSNNVILNQIEIYNSDKILIEKLRFDFSSAKALYRILRMILLCPQPTDIVYYDLPIYSTKDVCRVSVINRINTFTNTNITMKLEFESVNNSYKSIQINMKIEEYMFFLDQFFFCLLIDLVSDPWEE